jgi:hypothetical protein
LKRDIDDIIGPMGTSGAKEEPVSRGSSLLWEVISMPKGKERRPGNKEEEQDTTLDKVVNLAPLFALILRLLEIILKLLGVIG